MIKKWRTNKFEIFSTIIKGLVQSCEIVSTTVWSPTSICLSSGIHLLHATLEKKKVRLTGAHLRKHTASMCAQVDSLSMLQGTWFLGHKEHNFNSLSFLVDGSLDLRCEACNPTGWKPCVKKLLIWAWP